MPVSPATDADADADDETTRILFVIGTLDIGGAERQLVELATGLDRRFSPMVCCLTGAGPLARDLEAAGVPVMVVGMRGIRQARGLARVTAILTWPAGLFRLLRFVRRSRPHILHGLLFHGYVLGAFAGRVAGVAIVVASRRSLSHFKQHRRLYRLLEDRANRWTRLVIANSEAVRADAMQSEGLPADKVIVIHNGLDLAAYQRDADPHVRDQFGAGEGPTVLVVANLIAYKGHREFLEAWREVCLTWPSAVALLAGDGPERPVLEAQVREAGLVERVRFLGTRRDVPALLAVADLLVHPSREEGFCNAIIEAMAAGRPVVATSVGGNREAIIEGRTGLIVPPDNPSALAKAMLEILGREDRGRSLGRDGQRRAMDAFGRATMIGAYERVYRQLTTNRDQHDVRHRRAI